MPSILDQWERERTPRWRRAARRLWTAARGPLAVIFVASVGYILGARSQFVRASDRTVPQLEREVERLEAALHARRGELTLTRLELARAQAVMESSARHRIPADLAGAIYDISLSEGIDPELAYRLIRVESGFYTRAVSPKGAVGLTQVMPRTAFELDPGLRYSDLFDPDINLRLGFRYLRRMLERYDGDLRLALLAYNRGPGTVDGIREDGGDPANGYARAVMDED